MTINMFKYTLLVKIALNLNTDYLIKDDFIQIFVIFSIGMAGLNRRPPPPVWCYQTALHPGSISNHLF